MLSALGAVTAALVAGDLARRYVPWIDPWCRIRWRLPRSAADRPRCAITFDDGPSPGTAAVLDALAAADVRATFFVLAGNAERYPALVRRAASEGHTIAIHGSTHRTLEFASSADAELELGGARARIERLGVATAALYRAPHGRKSPATLRVAQRLGLQPWAWTRGIYDTRGASAAQLVERASRCIRDRMVLLLHDGRDDRATPDITPLVTALPRILDGFAARGFEFVTLNRV